jgi:AbiV family abortive infection protein
VLGLADRSEERYWFGTEPADPEANLAYLGTIRAWARRHNKLKQRGLYVDIDEVGGVLAPTDVADRESLLDVISHVHQIGWQCSILRLVELHSQAWHR